MPVVRLELPRLKKLVGADLSRIVEKLPYIGLDIESSDRTSIRVEYSPNRPDFGTDFGIARALRGLMGKQLGLPRFATTPSGISVSEDKRLAAVRPFIACATAKGLRLDDEDVRQLISLQEDLHNGLGRNRRTAAIGLHDMARLRPPFSYRAVQSTFKFTPLGRQKKSTIARILSGTPEGRDYGPALGKSRYFPIISDSAGNVLSFPPVINGNLTKVTTKTRDMFVDVTSTDKRTGDDVLAIVATTLAEMGAKIETVSIGYSTGHRSTPDLAPTELPLNIGLIRSLLGLDLTKPQITAALGRSRIGVARGRAVAPRYRLDLLHPVDIAEEVALGYGVDRIESIYPPSKQPGAFNPFEQFLDSASTVMSGAGMIEMMTYELSDEKSLYSSFGRSSAAKIAVHEPRSSEHSLLRDSVLPTLLAALTSNIKSDYPQRVFEIGRVYARNSGGVSESWHMGCLVAHSQASYSEAKMYLESMARTLAGKELTSREARHWAFSAGRSASVSSGRWALGQVGELTPEAIDASGLNVPVSGFEIDLSLLYKQLK